MTRYDKAILNHTLAVGESYIACLSTKCGKYFSTEDCKGNKRGPSKIACPYCDYKMCMECSRPWKSHRSGDCSKAKEKDDEKSRDAIKKMGAKPCPKCGVIIQKSTGCDHMTCKRQAPLFYSLLHLAIRLTNIASRSKVPPQLLLAVPRALRVKRPPSRHLHPRPPQRRRRSR